jgi:hypothetical protein
VSACVAGSVVSDVSSYFLFLAYLPSLVSGQFGQVGRYGVGRYLFLPPIVHQSRIPWWEN